MARPAVRVEGMDRTLRKLQRIKKPIRPLMRKAVNVGRKAARQAAKPHPGDVGSLGKGKNLRTKVSRGEIPEEGRVLTFSPVVEKVVRGRRRGDRPSSTEMARWAERHGIPARRGFTLAAAIGRRGSEGVPIFEEGREKLEQRLPDLVREAAGDIKREWKRG